MKGGLLRTAGLRHAVLITMAVVVALPLYLAVVAASHRPQALLGHFPLLPGGMLLDNLRSVLEKGLPGTIPVWRMLLNSFIMALGITIGKLFISILSAYAVCTSGFQCAWPRSG